MNTNDAPGAAPRPLLMLDREELRLSSPRGERVTGSVTLSNRGGALLDGFAAVRSGKGWLRVAPTSLQVPAGESLRLYLEADPRLLTAGHTYGEIALVTNGGTATLPVRLAVRVRAPWRPFAVAFAAVAVVALVAAALANVAFPDIAPPSSVATARHQHVRAPAAPPIDERTARVEIQRAILASNDAWREALSSPSTAPLAAVKTGDDLKRTAAEARDLQRHHERWTIVPHGDARVSAIQLDSNGTSATADLEKTERRALYGPDHPGVPYVLSYNTYRLRYHLTLHDGRWLVDGEAVADVTPRLARPVLDTPKGVAAQVYPFVVRVEADGTMGKAVGTGIIVRSSSSGSDVLTNDHVVAGATTFKIRRWVLGHGFVPETPWVTKQVQQDPADDLAVIHISAGDLTAATWSDSRALSVGDHVFSVGYALDLDGNPTLTPGLVSSATRTIPGDADGATYVQHSASINRGNSGGPLVDMSGSVVGVNNMMPIGTQGIFFAIPSSRALPVMYTMTGTNG